mmetsp:Transcript_13298/g.23503  ORF Transcript_13298/g.23503 Transcript_13298/m.23503 type:complete len:255 (+) Transcript_13298:86-850(+)
MLDPEELPDVSRLQEQLQEQQSLIQELRSHLAESDSFRRHVEDAAFGASQALERVRWALEDRSRKSSDPEVHHADAEVMDELLAAINGLEKSKASMLASPHQASHPSQEKLNQTFDAKVPSSACSTRPPTAGTQRGPCSACSSRPQTAGRRLRPASAGPGQAVAMPKVNQAKASTKMVQEQAPSLRNVRNAFTQDRKEREVRLYAAVSRPDMEAMPDQGFFSNNAEGPSLAERMQTKRTASMRHRTSLMLAHLD